MTDYLCSACGATVTSDGTEAADHMANEHGVVRGPDATPLDNEPYLVPVESNPGLDSDGVPT